MSNRKLEDKNKPIWESRGPRPFKIVAELTLQQLGRGNPIDLFRYPPEGESSGFSAEEEFGGPGR